MSQFTSSIIWYRSERAVMLCGWEGNCSRLASHWPCIMDLVFYPHTGLMALSTMPMLWRDAAYFTF